MRWFPLLCIGLLIVFPLAAANQPAGPDEPDEPAPATYDGEHADPCAEAHDRLKVRLAEIEERYRKEHEALAAEHAAYYSEPRTREEQAAFDARMEERRQALYEAEAREQHDAHAVFQSECEASAPAEGSTAEVPEPAPGAWMDEGCQEAVRAADAARHLAHERFENDLRARWDAFEADMRAAWEAFDGEGNRSEEEVQRFVDEMETKRAAFRHEMRAYEETQRVGMEAALEDSHAAIEAACHSTPMHGTAPVTALPAEIEALHSECDGKVTALETALDAEMHAMQASWDDTNESARHEFHDKMEAKRIQFEDQLRLVMRECQERARLLWEEKMGGHLEAQAPVDRMGSWSYEMAGGRILLTGKYVSLVGDPTTNTLGRIAVGGETFISGLDTLGRLEFFDMEESRDGDSTLYATGEGLRLRIHDAPSGVINLHARKDVAYLLTLPASIEVAEAPNGWTLRSGADSAFLRTLSGHSEWSGTERVMKVWGESTFFVDGRAENGILPTTANKHRTELVDAMKERRLGAEVSVAKDVGGDAVDDAIIYDSEVEVQVESPKKGEEAPVVVTVSSHTLSEGRTFVVNLETAILGKNVHIAYFDVDEESGAETPASIRKASSLSDVLDATDDEGAEYWIVEDEDGLQVLVSVSHWSVHRFRLVSAPPEDGLESLPAPAALVAVAFALGLAARSRRRLD